MHEEVYTKPPKRRRQKIGLMFSSSKQLHRVAMERKASNITKIDTANTPNFTINFT